MRRGDGASILEHVRKWRDQNRWSLAQTSVGGHQGIEVVERANGSAGAVASVFSGRAISNANQNHSRYTVVTMDVAAFCLDGGTVPVRSKNETDSA